MQAPKIQQLLLALGSKQVGMGAKWVRGTCPLAPWTHDSGADSTPSFGVHIETSKFSHFNCFACQQKGTLFDLVLLIAQNYRKQAAPYPVNFDRAWELVHAENDEVDELSELDELQDFDYDEVVSKEPPFHEFPQEWLDSFPEGWAHPYMKERGIPAGLGKKLNVRFDPVRGRICFPFYDFNGRLAGLHGRAISSDNPLRYYAYAGPHEERNPHVWIGENHVTLDKPVVICEGPFDYARIRAVTDNVLCCRSASIGADMATRIRMAGTIVTLFDRGKGGDIGRENVAKLFHQSNVYHVLPPEPYDDAGETPYGELEELLEDYL